MTKDKKEEPKATGRATAASKKAGRPKKAPEEHRVVLPPLSLPSTSKEPDPVLDEDALHDRLMDCRSMARPTRAGSVRRASSDEESVYASHIIKRRRVKTTRGDEEADSDYCPRSPSPRVDPGLGDAVAITEFRVWLSEEFLKVRGKLDHLISEVSRIGRRLTDVEEGHRLEKTRIRSLQEKSLAQTGNPPPNPTVPMSAPPSTSRGCETHKSPWGSGSGVL